MDKLPRKLRRRRDILSARYTQNPPKAIELRESELDYRWGFNGCWDEVQDGHRLLILESKQNRAREALLVEALELLGNHMDGCECHCMDASGIARQAIDKSNGVV